MSHESEGEHSDSPPNPGFLGYLDKLTLRITVMQSAQIFNLRSLEGVVLLVRVDVCIAFHLPPLCTFPFYGADILLGI